MRYHTCLVPMIVALLGGHAGSTDPAPTVSASSHPNIVIIYADDLGFGDVACYNPHGKILTPNIDRLANEGMRFTDAHSSSGVCTPSRYTLLTGRYHWRSRLQSGIVNKWGKPLIAPDRLTLAGLLKPQGYQTACIGKWHLGWDWLIAQENRPFMMPNAARDAVATDEHRRAWQAIFSQPIAGGPTSRGFDEYFGTDVPNWPPYCFIENDRTVGIPTEFLPPALFQNTQASLQGPALPEWKFEGILPALGERASQFIQRAAETENPYFLYMPLTSPHTPISVNEEWKGRSGLHPYADLVMETDAIIGRVLAAIEASGEASNTVVIFTSDNGKSPRTGLAELGAQGHFSSGPFRGSKADVWEGGHRVPFIVRWPDVVDPGAVNEQLVHQADLMATFANIVGTDVPWDAGEDSFSLLPLLRGNDVVVRESAVSASSRGMPSVRAADWKLVFGPGSGGWARGGDEEPVQLYHLGDDPSESNNLHLEHPEIVEQLSDLMATLVERGRSNPGPTQENDVAVQWRRFLPKDGDD